MGKFRIRCSSLGDLMAGSIRPSLTKEIEAILKKVEDGKELTSLQSQKLGDYNAKMAAPPEPSAGMKTLGKNWYTEQRYQRRKISLGGAATMKGIKMEEDAIKYTESVLGFFGWEKNEEHLSNDYLMGTPDVITDNYIIDLKCSYDCFSFDPTDIKINSDYWHQLQGYMALTGVDKAILVYALMDLPKDMVMNECWRVARSRGLDEVTEELFEEVEQYNTYSNLPDNMRVKAFFFDAVDGYAKEVEDRVGIVRNYINTLDAPNVITAEGEKIYL